MLVRQNAVYCKAEFHLVEDSSMLKESDYILPPLEEGYNLSILNGICSNIPGFVIPP